MTISAEQAAKLLEGTTTGPWQAVGTNVCVGRGLRFRHLLRAWRTWDEAGNETTEGNAALSAAAPDLARALIASETARKLAEERLAKAVEGLNDQALFLEQSHAARMASIDRDPEKYASDLSMMAQRVREILKEIDNG